MTKYVRRLCINDSLIGITADSPFEAMHRIFDSEVDQDQGLGKRVFLESDDSLIGEIAESRWCCCR